MTLEAIEGVCTIGAASSPPAPQTAPCTSTHGLALICLISRGVAGVNAVSPRGLLSRASPKPTDGPPSLLPAVFCGRFSPASAPSHPEWPRVPPLCPRPPRPPRFSPASTSCLGYRGSLRLITPFPTVPPATPVSALSSDSSQGHVSSSQSPPDFAPTSRGAYATGQTPQASEALQDAAPGDSRPT